MATDPPRTDTAAGSPHFGESAKLLFAADPIGALSNVALKIVVEGTIEYFSTGITGSGMAIDRTSITARLDPAAKTLTWGQHMLEPGCAMQIGLEGSGPLGRVTWKALDP